VLPSQFSALSTQPALGRAPLPNRFYGTVEIDPDRASLDFSTVVSEVIQQFTTQTGARR
jgi:hypothetical protein